MLLLEFFRIRSTVEPVLSYWQTSCRRIGSLVVYAMVKILYNTHRPVPVPYLAQALANALLLVGTFASVVLGYSVTVNTC